MTYFRMLADGPEGYDIKAGQLVFAANRGKPLELWLTARADGQGRAFTMPKDQVERGPPITSDDFTALMDYYLSGRALIPNFEPVDTAMGLRAIASGGGSANWPGLARVKMPGDNSNWGAWARVFVEKTQWGQLDGTAIFIWYQTIGVEYPIGPVGRFTLCKHDHVTGPGARPERGWHPGRCAKCGLDMTVDSSD